MSKKQILSAIAILLTLTFLVSTVAYLPAANAQTDTKQSYAVIMAEPNPVGVGQQMNIILGITEPLPDMDYSWTGLTVTVTKPDNTTATLGPYSTDPTGTTYATYTPTETGTYYFQTNFPGNWLNTTSYHRWYAPSTSQKLAVTVQQEPVSILPDNPLPTAYWTRPINSENRLWEQIAGNWLMAFYDGSNNPYNPYTTAPDSPHIMWTKPIDFGGIVGGNLSGYSYYNGEAYENKWNPPIIMNGLLYYTQPLGSSSKLGTVCVDIRTGQEVWSKDFLVSFGQLLNFNSPDQHGVIPYLWATSGTTYQMYDASTGEWILNITNVPRGTMVFGPSGELLIYALAQQGNVLKISLWNSTDVDGFLSLVYGVTSPMWRPPYGASLNGTTGIMWTVTTPPVAGRPSTLFVADNVLVAAAYSPEQTARGLYTQEAGWMQYGFSLAPGTEGQLLWAQNRTVAGNATMMITGARGTLAVDGVYTALIKETKQYIGYDLQTGNQLWSTPAESSDWANYRMGGQVIAYDKFYTADYSGQVIAYYITNGTVAWTYFDGSSEYNTPYGQNPFCAGVTGQAPVLIAADGIIFAVNNEHSPTEPLYRGYQMHAINASTGDRVWTILGWYQHPAIADGYLVTLNAADNQIYSFGKGPTKTTVEAPMSGVTQGSGMVIRGSVTDLSEGAKQDAVAANFPNGLPAVSDASMSQFMEAVYMQQPMLNNITGVPVVLSAIDSNGNYRQIGITTSDASGMFTYSWTPDIPGNYTVIATFVGSEGYFGSSAETSFYANPPAPTSTTTSSAVSSSSMTDTYVIAGVIAIIIVIAIGFAVTILTLRKRP